MEKGKKETSSTSQVFEINELKSKFHTPEAIFAGVCALNGWKSGKCVSEEEYKIAVAKFLKKPINEEGSKK